MFKINVIEFNNVYISGNVHSIDIIRNFCDVSHAYNLCVLIYKETGCRHRRQQQQQQKVKNLDFYYSNFFHNFQFTFIVVLLIPFSYFIIIIIPCRTCWHSGRVALKS
jgi:hypothetical protein